MLPNINLDNSGFDEILKKARNEIHDIYPSWNDYNYHDPGITILEVLAFLKEAQQFYLNEDRDEVKKKFFEFIGGFLLKIMPAQTIGKIYESHTLHQGTKFYMDHICFESEQEENLVGDIITSIIVKERNGGKFNLKVAPIFKDRQMTLYPFGKNAEKGSQFYLCLREKLEKDSKYSLAFFFKEEHKIKRNPIKDEQKFMPLSDIKLSLYTIYGYQEIKMKDQTIGFLQDGMISFSIGEDMVLTKENGCEGYFLRFTLENSFFDTSPIISDLGFSFLNLVQRDTKAIFMPIEQGKCWSKSNKICDYYRIEGNYYEETTQYDGTYIAVYERDYYHIKNLAIGNGFPNQIYHIEGDGIESSQFKILVESIRYKGKFHLYEQVEDFDSSKTDSYHYVIEERSGIISFGNGIRGNMPETQIRIVGLAFCKAEQGNITKGKNLFYSHNLEAYKVINYKDATGGCQCQSINEGFYKLISEKKPIKRMVTTEDFESAIRNAQGLRIDDCKVLVMEDFLEQEYENKIEIVVKPYAEEGMACLSERYQQNILSSIEDKRLLGSSIKLYSPSYFEIEVSIEVCVKPQFTMAQKYVENEVCNYFESLSRFGVAAEYGTLYRLIDSLEAVQEIRSLSMNPKSKHILRNHNGDILTPMVGVLILEKINCIILN